MYIKFQYKYPNKKKIYIWDEIILNLNKQFNIFILNSFIGIIVIIYLKYNTLIIIQIIN